MSRKVRFNKKILATVIASSALTGMSGFAFAQDETVEEVMVTGIRASMERAMDIKRESAGVVDAISAEDMGKFPDTNLAESLQRITGVSIDRTNGEGSKVTVRGFGPEYNMVTLNGRTMPTGGAYAGTGGASRAFDFANLASEAVSAVEVYKTSKANITTGGIGSTIDIKTTRPLDNGGFKASVGAKAVMDTTNRTGDDLTPELSGLISWADDSDAFGVSLSASYQERDSGSTGATVNDWVVGVWGEDILYDLPASSPVFSNAPTVGQLYSRPKDVRYVFSDQQRDRTNAQLTFQYRPVENVTATLDYTFAEKSVTEHRGEVTTWVQNGTNLTSVVFDNSAIATPKTITEYYQGGVKDVGFSQQYRAQDDTLDSVGLNVEWEVNDQLTVNVDLHDSSLESLPKGPNGVGDIDLGVGAPTKTGAKWWFSGYEIPVWNHTLNDTIKPGNSNGILDEGDLSSSVMRMNSSEQMTDVTQAKVDASWKFDDGRFDFGIERREMSTTSNYYNGNNNQILGGWGADVPGEFGPGAFDFINVAGEFDDFNTGTSPGIGFKADARDLAAILVKKYSGSPHLAYIGLENTALRDTNNQVVVRNSKSTDTIEENTDAFYFQLSTTGQLAGFDVDVLTGVRYETTHQTSISGTPLLKHFVWESDNDFSQVSLASGTKPPEKNDYDALLPSLDVSVKLTEDVVSRFAFSKTIARPALGLLSSGIGGYGIDGSTLISAKPGANVNNPHLKPLESTNFDMSVEWYFDEASYLSAGVFEKRVVNFIGNEEIKRTIGDIRDQTAGPRAKAAAAALQSRGFTVDNVNLYTMMAILRDPVQFPNGALDFNDTLTQKDLLGEGCKTAACDFIPDSNDPLMMFTVDTPVNNREAKLYGAEFAAQHFFGETGFGVMANYTVVRGDVKFDNLNLDSKQFSLLGLSDTANLVLMYDNYNIEARLAYNWRDEFLAQTGWGSGNPRYVEAYSQIDMNVTYHIIENLSISVEGINITGEDRRDHARSKDMMISADDLGARYQIGARYTF
jgi:TonB-dependent receptor